MAQLRERIAEVRDLTVDGFPYKDSERVRLELQIRQSVRQAFGDGSPEYQKHQYLRLKPDDLGSTIGLLEDLIGRLQKQKFELPDELRSASTHTVEVERETPEEPQSEAPTTTAEWTPTTAARQPRGPISRASSDDPPPRTAAQAPLPASPEPPSTSAAGGKTGPSAVHRPADQAPVAREVTPQKAAHHQHVSNGRTTSNRGESSMIANKSRHEGTDTLVRETHPEPWAGENTSSLAAIRKLCTGFHAVARQLRQRHDDRPTLDVEDEHDVQDLFHALLRLEFQDIRTERWVPSYAGGDERTTFLFGADRLALVIKRTRPGLGGRELKAQLDIDAQRYSGRPDCQTLLCFVYDPEGRIANPREFEAASTRDDEGGTVAVQISP